MAVVTPDCTGAFVAFVVVMATSASARSSSSVRHGWLAALASAILPGWGQAYLGQRARALQLFAIDAAILATISIAMGWFRIELVKAWVSPTALVVILMFNLALLVFRSMASANAYVAGEATRDRSLASHLGLVAAGAVIVLPHLAVGWIALVQYDLITSVFAEPDPVIVAASPTTTTLASTTVGAVVGSTTTTTIPTTTTTTEPVLWDGLERLNVVLLGADAGEGRRGLRTDTTIVLSIDPRTGDTAMFSVPRDLSNAPLPEGMGLWSCNCFPDLITHLYDSAVRYPDAFPGPGEPPINAIKASLGEIFGMPIHYYAMVTLDGFVGIVDALGGVTIEVPKTIVDRTYPHENGSTAQVVIEEGTRHLDGHNALAYARIRRGSSDFARMHRQRCVLGAVVSQTSPIEIVASFGALASAVKEHVSTDIPQDRLVDFVDLIPKVSTDRIATLRITRTVYKTSGAPGRVYYDIERIRADAQALIADPAAAQAKLGLDALDATCEESFD